MSMTGGGIYPEMDDQSEPLKILVISCDSLASKKKAAMIRNHPNVHASRYFEGRSWGCAGLDAPCGFGCAMSTFGAGWAMRQWLEIETSAAEDVSATVHCFVGKDEHAESFHEQAAAICFYKKSLYYGLLLYNMTRHMHRCIISDVDQCCTYSFPVHVLIHHDSVVNTHEQIQQHIWRGRSAFVIFDASMHEV